MEDEYKCKCGKTFEDKGEFTDHIQKDEPILQQILNTQLYFKAMKEMDEKLKAREKRWEQNNVTSDTGGTFKYC